MQVSLNFRETLLQQIPKGSNCAEIGVFKGTFSKKILQIVKPRKLYLIDPWRNSDDPSLKNSWYANSSKNDMQKIHMQVIKNFKNKIDSGEIEVQRGFSSQVLSGHADDSFDFIYIDGDHRFESVLEDLRLSAAKVRQGGYIGLDDYALGSWWGDGVIRAVNIFLGEESTSFRIAWAMGNQLLLRRGG